MKNSGLNRVALNWDPAQTPVQLQTALRILGEEYPISDSGEGGIRLSFIPVEDHSYGSVKLADNQAAIRYGSLPLALRAVSSLLSGLSDGQLLEERSDFTTVSMMLDCSRNAVITVENFKRWLRRLALMGYNQAMLYTEDTYELPDEPCFGFQRGRYSLNELQEIDEYAARLGIEMIGCIQTLGHSAQYLRWPAYAGVADTRNTLLVGEEKTYVLIEKMIAQMSKAFRSCRMHIGMDEAFDLGTRNSLEGKPSRSKFDMFVEHLNRVCDICRKYGVKPMIWSDMFFRIGSKTHDYYDLESRIPKEVINEVPTDVQLCYWDYYHEDKESYLRLIEIHERFGSVPIVVPNVWDYVSVWYNHSLTVRTLGPCIDACREKGVKEIIVSVWGDDGCYCDQDSSLAGLAYAAEKMYRDAGDEDEILARRFKAICHADYFGHRRAGQLDGFMGSGYILWDDPMYALIVRNLMGKEKVDKTEDIRRMREIADDLLPLLSDDQAGNIHHAWLMARFLAEKISICDDLYEAYISDDRLALAEVKRRSEEITGLIREIAISFRRYWMRRNKPFGFEVLQIRFAGLIARYEELATRLGEYLDGTVASIPELDGNIAPPDTYLPGLYYRHVATTSDIF